MVEENSDSLTGLEDKAPWQERRKAYIAAIASKSPDALRVSVADKLHKRALFTDYRTVGDHL